MNDKAQSATPITTKRLSSSLRGTIVDEDYKGIKELLSKAADDLENEGKNGIAADLRERAVDIVNELLAYRTALEYIANGHPNAALFVKQLLSIK